jgi:hypothetical protein
MNKKNVLLKLHDALADVDMGYEIYITLWEADGKYMIDRYITEVFPSLISLGIEDIAEGYSGYIEKGTSKAESITHEYADLINKLADLGFTKLAVSEDPINEDLTEILEK